MRNVISWNSLCLTGVCVHTHFGTLTGNVLGTDVGIQKVEVCVCVSLHGCSRGDEMRGKE